jgi:hypothetical protein
MNRPAGQAAGKKAAAVDRGGWDEKRPCVICNRATRPVAKPRRGVICVRGHNVQPKRAS